MIQTQILKYFLSNQQAKVTIADLAKALAYNEELIEKEIVRLQRNGYHFTIDENKHFQLTETKKTPDAAYIQAILPTQWQDLSIQCFDTVTSTNDLAKDAYLTNKKPHLVVSRHQSQGRGRQGRSFFSELQDGLYFSLALQPITHDPQLLPLYTLATATAVVQAIHKLTALRVDIKWVNDLFFNGKKIAGILAESVHHPESPDQNAIIIGIGINLAGDFSKANPDIQKVAGSLYKQLPTTFNYNVFLVEFLSLFFDYHFHLSDRTFLPYYDAHLLGKGQIIDYYSQQRRARGQLIGINNNGNLLVKKDNGELHTLTAGDIHLSSHQFATD